jgi:hypothetical protein
MTLPSLFKLTSDYVQLMHKLDDQDLDAQTIADTIESTGLTDDISTKCQGYVMVARTFGGRVHPIKEEIKRLQKLCKHCENTEQRLYDEMLYNMQAAQIERIVGPTMTITIRQNPESVDVFDAAQIPADYMREVPATFAPDKALIKAALKSDADVPGCKLTRTLKLHIT